MKESSSSRVPLKPVESLDEFMEGRLRLIQSKRGYRFSIDAVLLSQFVTVKEGDRVVDLGTGCGIVPLLLLLTRPVSFAVGIEIQQELADQAARNALLNGFNRRMGVILGDLRHAPLSPCSADVVVCNPPYRQVRTGRINPDPQRAVARHEMLASLEDILRAAGTLLRPKGRLAVIYPAARLADTLVRMRGFNLEPKRIRLVYPGLQSEAKLVLVEALLGGRPGVKVLPPLLEQGDFSISMPS